MKTGADAATSGPCKSHDRGQYMPHDSAPQGAKVLDAEFLRQLDEIQVAEPLPEAAAQQPDKAALRALMQATSDRIKAENEQMREARNARRWKAERDPLEYEAQKERQRREYQPRGGGPVRSYEKLTGATKAEREDEAKARHAEREAKRYAALTPDEKQAKSDRIADDAWIARRRDKGIPEEIIQAGLIVRLQEREVKRAMKAQEEAEEAAWRNLPHFDMFQR